MKRIEKMLHLILGFNSEELIKLNTEDKNVNVIIKEGLSELEQLSKDAELGRQVTRLLNQKVR